VQILLIQDGVTQNLLGGPGNYVVGEAARFANVTLTAGTDLDQDGLPDAWEEELILKTALGINRKEHKDRKEWNL